MDTVPAIRSKSLVRRAADAVVVVLHPCFLFMYLYLAYTFPQRQLIPGYFLLTGTVMVGTIVLPALITLVYSGDMFLGQRNQRFVPLLFSAILYSIVLYALCQVYNDVYMQMVGLGHGEHDMNPQFSVSELVASSVILINLVRLLIMLVAGLWMAAFVSKFFKISLHALGAGFICTVVMLPFFFTIVQSGLFSSSGFFTSIILAVLCGLMIWQRRASGAHTMPELGLGLVVGAMGAGIISIIPQEFIISAAFKVVDIF